MAAKSNSSPQLEIVHGLDFACVGGIQARVSVVVPSYSQDLPNCLLGHRGYQQLEADSPFYDAAVLMMWGIDGLR